MESIQLDQADKSSPETSCDSSVPPDSPDTSDIFGEPLANPRVGDEYQVEIPHVVSKSELLYLKMNPADSENTCDSSPSFLIGLEVPVMLICNPAKQVIDERMEPVNNFHELSSNKAMESVNTKVDAPSQSSSGDLHFFVPGLSSHSWSDFETDCFLLGLYIFGKNLLQVSRFMDNKAMSQILSFYYGRFYGSAGYRKWSECRKMRNKKNVLGHRFFTGYRQQELFSRLLPQVSDECKTKLLEVSRAFTEGRTPLDEYVSMLKASFGVQALVEAVGIGKGKDDLTTFFLDSSKNNQMFTHRLEMPSGKACSSLTCAEIVKYLTGDFRLSKARSNDLFWEAVWPRLLARGWHSEQPRVDVYAGSKNCLVFLMPGIKKFSRRKLSRGEHYFDSVSDVLAKVASEPELLELEVDETEPRSCKEENGWGVELNSDDDQAPFDDHGRHCYLKPRVSAGFSNLTKFTVVDTSLATEDNPCQVRELRSLPLEAKKSSTLSRHLRKIEKESQGNVDILPKGVMSDNSECQRMNRINFIPPKMPADHKPRTIKHQFSRRLKPGLSGCSGPVTKRRRLGSYGEADVTYVLSLPATNKNFVSQPLMKVSSTDSSIVSTSNEMVPKESLNASHTELEKGKKPEERKVIDLNVPQVPSESEIDVKVKVEERESKAKRRSDVKSKQKVEEGENKGNRRCDAVNSKQRVEEWENKAKRQSCVVNSKRKVEEGENKANRRFLTIKFKHRADDRENSTNHHSKSGKPEFSDAALASGPVVSSGANKIDGSVVSCAANKVNGFVVSSAANKVDGSVVSSAANKVDESIASNAANKVDVSDQLPRRQSTRNRPLTTKALEALEIGFMKPVRRYRKRSESTAQDQKSKRSRQPHSKNSLFPNDVGIEERAIDGMCNGKTNSLGDPFVESIPTKNEAASSKLPGVSEASSPLEASLKEELDLAKC